MQKCHNSRSTSASSSQRLVASARAAGGQRNPQRPARTSSVRTAAGFGDFFKDIFDMNTWAPKSTRIWRMQQYTPPDAAESVAADDQQAGADSGLQGLQARINELRDSQGPPTPAGAAAGSSSSSFSRGSSPSSSSLLPPVQDDELDGVSASGSLSDADDADVATALNQRIKQIATTTGEWGSSMDEEEMRQPLTGEEIRRLLITKYNKQYDMSFVRRNLPGMGPCVSLNIMWLHADQASFKMTPAQYAEKLDSVAALVNVLGQTDKVRAFLKAPAKSMKGLPRRPVVGTAISIRLDLDRAQISEWFGQGYD